MNIEKLIKQNEQMDGFRAGYAAALQWMAAELEMEKKAEEAKKADEAKNADDAPKA